MPIYEQLKNIFDVFNDKLFGDILGDKIPDCIITLQRKTNLYAEMNHQNFVELNSGAKASEIALNPQWFGVKPRIEILQYIAHQMMHVYQHQFGDVVKSGKHDEQFLDFMNAIGLMPSDTGLPDGQSIGGKKILNYPLPDGPFMNLVNELAEADQLITWFELEKPKNLIVDNLIKELFEKKEMLGDSVHPSLLHIPLLINQNIDVDALLDCLTVDATQKGVVVDSSKASKLAEKAIVENRQVREDKAWEEIHQSESDSSHTVKPVTDPVEEKDLSGFQVLTESTFKDDTEGDAADIFIKQAIANKPEGFENHAHPGQQKVVKSTDEIAAILGLASATGEEKKPVNKREYKYTCSCNKSVKAGPGMSVICGHCQLHFMCETLESETNIVQG